MSNLRDTEMAVLYASIQSPIAMEEAKRRLTASDFYYPDLERIWTTMLRLQHHGKDVGIITIQQVMAGDDSARRTLLDLVGMPAIPEHVGNYADIVRDKATLRRLHTEATRVAQLSDPLREREGVSGRGLAASVATRFAAIRDSGLAGDDMDALTIEELMDLPDERYDWIIPDLIERKDRLILTGEEGLGKSHLLRQIAMFAAAGLDPFTERFIEPRTTTIIDCENTQQQIRRAARDIYEYAKRNGRHDPGHAITVECSKRVDLTADRDLARIHHLLDATNPDIVIIGPLYRLSPRAIQTDDEAAPLLAALDTIRDRGIALLIEAHAGHAIGRGNMRDMRPRGSSALLGWPEFGYGMRGEENSPNASVIGWRGPRDARKWPKRIQRRQDGRWVPIDLDSREIR